MGDAMKGLGSDHWHRPRLTRARRYLHSALRKFQPTSGCQGLPLLRDQCLTRRMGRAVFQRPRRR